MTGFQQFLVEGHTIRLDEDTVIRKGSIWYHGSGFNGKATTRLRKPTAANPLYVTNSPHFAETHTPESGLADDNNSTFYIFIMSAAFKALDLSKESDCGRLGLPECMTAEITTDPHGNDIWSYYRSHEFELCYLLDFQTKALLGGEPFPEQAVDDLIRRDAEYNRKTENYQPKYDKERMRQYWKWLMEFFRPKLLKKIAAYNDRFTRAYSIAQGVYEKALSLGYDAALTREAPSKYRGEQTLVLFRTTNIAYVSDFRRPLSYRECEEFFERIGQKQHVSKKEIESFLRGLDYAVPLSYADKNGDRNYDAMLKWRKSLAAEKR